MTETGVTLLGIFYVLVGTSMIWVFFDAPAHKLSRTWAIGVFLMWIIGFPWYLAKRAAQDRLMERADRAGHGPGNGWYPDPWDDAGTVERYKEQETWTLLRRPLSKSPDPSPAK